MKETIVNGNETYTRCLFTKDTIYGGEKHCFECFLDFGPKDHRKMTQLQRFLSKHESQDGRVDGGFIDNNKRLWFTQKEKRHRKPPPKAKYSPYKGLVGLHPHLPWNKNRAK